ncbi:SpoIIE family protein phosphatase [bacterium]|nr:SpoIIE family protein phosphatase [bacterium]
MFSRAKKFDKKVPAQIQYLGELRDFITEMGRQFGVSERVINAFKLAIDEAGTNIIRHAYRDWEGFITVRMIIRDKSVTVLLIDQGHTFDPTKVKDPDLQRYVDIGKKGGLGIFIIRRVIDKIDYLKTEEGNVLRLTKYREAKKRQPFVIPEMGMSMRLRYSLLASIIVSIFIATLSIRTLWTQSPRIREGHLEMGRAIAKFAASQSPEWLMDEATTELYTLANKIQQDHEPMVLDVLIVDTTGKAQVALQDDLLFKKFTVPSAKLVIDENTLVYPWQSSTSVYDLIEPVIVPSSDRVIGTVHLLLNKDLIDREVIHARTISIIIYSLILIFGCGFVFGLVYMIMSPFKRLTIWMRALGRGEVQDVMEFNATDEIGEIAHAFNEITEKFRKSQENLAEQERLQKEMQVAQEIQHTLLPAEFPEIEGYEIASYYEAAKEVGGDYFDFVEVDNDTLGIVVADVSGKGVPGSLVMTMIRTALRTEARGNKNAADVLARVNDFVMNDMKRGMFVTIFYIILDSMNRTINYASAGHNPMILYRNKTRKSYYLNPRGFPIGINLPDRTLFRRSIQSDTLHLREDDVLIIYTDGITEAMNPKRDRYGDERFLTCIRKFGNKQVKPLVENIREEIITFTEGFAQSDDITLVAIREKLRAEDVLFNLRVRLMKLVDHDGMSVKDACKEVGVSQSTYYKYRKLFLESGAEALKEKIQRSEIEEKHISIEEKAKIFDVIKENPEFGAKRISEELNTEKYGFTQIDEKRIYEELVRSRLNTKELRLAFVERGGRGKRMKPPGTPFLSLDGQVIMDTGIKRKQYHAPPEIGSDMPEFESEPVPDRKKVYDPIRGYGTSDTESDAKEDEIIPKEMEDAINLLDIQEIERGRSGKRSGSVASEDSIFDDMEVDNVIDFQDAVFRQDDTPGSEPGEEDVRPFSDLVDELLDVDDMNESSSPIQNQQDIASIIQDSESEAAQLDDGETGDIGASVVDDMFDREIRSKKTYRDKKENAESDGAFENLFDMLNFEHAPVMAEKESRSASVATAARDTHSRQYLESGQWFYKQELYAKAIEEFGKAIESNSRYTEAYQCLGDSYFRLGQLDKAREMYEKVRGFDPNNIDVLENLGVIHANQGDYKKAVWQWGEVLKRNPHRRDIIDRIKRMQKVIRQRSV